MLARLPEPDRTLLKGAPVNLVVFAFNFSTAESWPPQAGLRWRDAIKERGITGKLVGANQHQMTVTPGAPPEARLRRGYQIAQENGTAATLYEDGLVLEARQYDGWYSFRTVIQALIETAAVQRGIAVETGMTLRYVNALSDERATTAAFWHDKVNAAFLGPASDMVKPKA